MVTPSTGRRRSARTGIKNRDQRRAFRPASNRGTPDQLLARAGEDTTNVLPYVHDAKGSARRFFRLQTAGATRSAKSSAGTGSRTA